jgi:unsaturated rhamnogalacturonyl hydrolase
MSLKRILKITSLVIVIIIGSCTNNQQTESIHKEDVLNLIIKVNDHYQLSHQNPGNSFWDNSAYHTGNIAAFSVTRNSKHLKYSEDWAIKNEWKGAKSDNVEDWRYTYGEGDQYVLFGDWQICFQTYIDLYNLAEKKDSIKIKRALEVINYQISTNENDYWWWADGLYMVMPVMTKLYKLTGDEIYLDKLYEYFSFAKGIMYDSETGLFYRDAKYVYPKHKTESGEKDFWSRGNGWVFAGLAKVLSDLPADYKYKGEFENIYKNMAVQLKTIQQTEGYWTRSLLDAEQAPGYETSGTAFFTYGFLWGINNGYLEQEDYLTVAQNSWKYLSQIAVDDNGRVGYVQPIGERAIPGQVVDENSTSNFGVGAFLLAASEMYNLLSR